MVRISVVTKVENMTITRTFKCCMLKEIKLGVYLHLNGFLVSSIVCVFASSHLLSQASYTR